MRIIGCQCAAAEIGWSIPYRECKHHRQDALDTERMALRLCQWRHGGPRRGPAAARNGAGLAPRHRDDPPLKGRIWIHNRATARPPTCQDGGEAAQAP